MHEATTRQGNTIGVDLWQYTAPDLAAALREIVNTLGPGTICSCPRPAECGLADEAADALRVARRALGYEACPT